MLRSHGRIVPVDLADSFSPEPQRLLIVVPFAALLNFGLQYLTYINIVDALRVFTGVPFGWVGGIL